MVDDLIRLVVYLTIVSMAAERAVDIVKRAVIQKLNITTLNGAVYQILAGVFGAFIAFGDQPSFDFITTNRWFLVVIIGLCTSGGSGAWNTILSILKELSIPKASDIKTP